MNDALDNANETSGRAVGRPLMKSVADRLASVKFAVAVIIVITVACVMGTILPQGSDALAYAQKNPVAAQRMALFARLGLTHVFSAWWFIALLCVLAASVVGCTTRRFTTFRRTTGFAKRRALGSMLSHISILLILTGAVIRGVWGEKGHIEFREGETKVQFVSNKGNHSLPFALALKDFAIERYDVAAAPATSSDSACCNQLIVEWPERQLTARLPVKIAAEQTLTPANEEANSNNTFRVTVLQYVPDFTIDTQTKEVTSRSDKPQNPAVLVAVAGPSYRNHRWLFAKFPDFDMHTEQSGGPSPLRFRYVNHGIEEAVQQGPVKSFKSALEVIEMGAVVKTPVVEVNRPFKYKGYTFYQSGYNVDDPGWSSLQVVRDPGVPLVYAGFGSLILGLFVVFYLNPWLESQKARA